jgi:hypothetical protein
MNDGTASNGPALEARQMTDLTPDEILDGLHALVARAAADADAAEDPVPMTDYGPPRPMAAPVMPPLFDRPGYSRPATVANRSAPAAILRVRG